MAIIALLVASIFGTTCFLLAVFVFGFGFFSACAIYFISGLTFAILLISLYSIPDRTKAPDTQVA